MTNALSRVTLTTPLGSGAFQLSSLQGREGLSELFDYRIEVLLERGRDIDFAKLLGAEVSVVLEQNGQARRLQGIIRRLGEVGEDATHYAYLLEVVPRFWLWTQRVRCRIFQDQTTPQILQQVLKGLDARFELSNDYRPHTYRTQFRESDHAFACRLMEEEGIYYFFREGSLVLADNSPASEELAGGPLHYSGVSSAAPDAPRVRRWKKFQELRPARVTLWDHSFQLPDQNLEASRTATASVSAGAVTHQPGLGSQLDLEIFDYPGGYGHRFDGIDAVGNPQPAQLEQVHDQNERSVRLRLEEQVAATLVIEAAGDEVRPVPGARFRLAGHGHADGDYLVTWVEQELRVPPPRSGESQALTYGNRFGALPLALPFRPPRVTPQPRPDGAQTATVVGPAGEEIHCDPYGRIKVHFHWDRVGQRDGTDSCWVRVASPWAGKGFGMLSLPRVGHEVVVTFLDGNLDRPLVTGSVYNANQMPPMPLPAKQAYSTITSQSLKNGDAGQFTALTLRDGEKEQLILQATHDIDLSAGEQVLVTAPEQWVSNIGETQIQVVGWYFPKLGGSAWKQDGGWERTDKVLQDLLGGDRMDVTRGTHVTACIGESNQYTWFSRNEVTIDPFSWSAGQSSWAGWSRNVVKGKVPTAKTTAVYGGFQNIGYGPMLNVQSGQVIGLVGTHPGWQKYATFHAVLTSACCLLPGLYGLTGNKAYLDANSIADLLGNACLAFLVTAERNYAKEQAIQTAGQVVERCTARGLQPGAAFSAHIGQLQKQAADLASNAPVLQTHDVHGSYALKCQWLSLLGEKGVLLSTAANSPIALLADGDIVLSASPEMAISLDTAHGILHMVNGNASLIRMSANTILLKAGSASVEIGPNDVKISGASVTLDATTKATVSGPTVAVGKAGAQGTLKGTSWNVTN